MCYDNTTDPTAVLNMGPLFPYSSSDSRKHWSEALALVDDCSLAPMNNDLLDLSILTQKLMNHDRKS